MCGVWCGVVWCGVVWCGVVWCGVCVCLCVCVCVHFSDGQGFWLTLVFFAYKDRQQITELFNRFSITATAFYGSKLSPCDLWQKKRRYYDRCCHSWSFGSIKFGCSHQDRVTIKSMLNSWEIHSLQVKICCWQWKPCWH